jgi:long-chain acyl-CoA synthetase
VVREFTSPATFAVPPSGSLTDDLLVHAETRPDAVTFSRREGPDWQDVSAAEFLSQVRSVAKGLVASGVGHGDRVALMSHTRFEWTLVDYAIWYVGAVTVPVYPSSPDDQVRRLLAHCGAGAAVVETTDHRAAVLRHAAAPGLAERVWTLDDGGVEALVERGRRVGDDDLEERRAAVTPSSLATIIYTSGTTGVSKGCMLTHGNLMSELGVAVEELEELFEGPDAATLLFLPLAHVFARVVAVGAVRAGVRLGHSSGARNLPGDLAAFRPTFVLAVPRVFEKLFNTASQVAAADGRPRTFDRAVEAAIAYSRALDHGRPGPLLRARHRFFERWVYRTLRETLGGRCRYAVSGGAPLGERLGHFYRGIGITVLEGYGLTETTAAVTVNRPDALKIGTVGRPLHGSSVRVADDGELHVRGGQVFRGYWQDEAATADALTADGWLRTGDVGEIDDEGFVRVTGRKLEILVTAGGKNVAPTALEDGLRAHALVSQCMVVGDGRPFVAALVTLDPEAVGPWARAHGKPADVAALVDDPDLRAEIQGAVDSANRAVSRAESIRGFTLLPRDWTEEAGQLTPSLKLRRSVVLSQHRSDVEALYAR